jgi:hypothetical protein
MIQITNSKQGVASEPSVGLVSVIGILNLLFVCILVLEYCYFIMNLPVY